jgi:hypothetical protein
MNVHEAASKLHRVIPGRPGDFNTLAFCDENGRPYIRVLVSAAFDARHVDLPNEYEGYRIVVERRGSASNAL